MKIKAVLLFVVIIFITLTSFALAKPIPQNTIPTKTNSSKTEILVDLKNIDQLEKLIETQRPGWFSTYGIIIVSILALIGTVVTSAISNRRSRLNTESQLKISTENLLKQIEANRILEADKRNADIQYKLKNELKEKIAKFIYSATKLNAEIGNISDPESDFHGQEFRLESLREGLTNLYYSIRVTLDGSKKQMELEEILTKYMNITCFYFDLASIEPDDYEQPIGKLFHKIKSIIHDNYQEPF